MAEKQSQRQNHRTREKEIEREIHWPPLKKDCFFYYYLTRNKIPHAHSSFLIPHFLQFPLSASLLLRFRARIINTIRGESGSIGSSTLRFVRSMEQAPVGLRGSVHDGATLESIQFNEEIQGIMAPAPAPENANSFTALLELPPTQAVELLHSPDSDGTRNPLNCHVSANHKPYLLNSFGGNLTFPSNAALIERAAKLSVFAGQNSSSPGEARLLPAGSGSNLDRVKNEPQETDSNPCSTQGCVSDPAVENKNERTAKRKEREKKVTVTLMLTSLTTRNWIIRVSVYGILECSKLEMVYDFAEFRLKDRRRRLRASPMRPPAMVRSFPTFTFEFVEVKPQIAIAWRKG